MPLFKCDWCGTVENSACCNYWNRTDADLCSACDPDIGKWHDRFPRRQATEADTPHMRIRKRHPNWDGTQTPARKDTP